MKEKQACFRFAGLLLLASFVASLLSGAVHELGHALVVTLAGANVQELHLLWIFGPPHIQYTGGLSRQASIWLSASGMLASVGLGGICLAFIPFKKLPPTSSLALGLIVAVLLSQSIAWVILPVLVMLGAKPQDDIIRFLQSSGMPSALLALSGLILVTACGWAFLKRTGFVAVLRGLRHDTIKAEKRPRAI